MFSYALRRLLSLLPTLIGLTLLILILMHLVPGTVVEQMLGGDAAYDEQAKASLRAFFGLDRPFHVQYLEWLGSLLRGDLGISWRTARPVVKLIEPRFALTAELALLTIIVSITVGVPLGILSAVKRRTAIDDALRLASLTGLSVPVFWQGSMLILGLSVLFRWMPPVIYTSLIENPRSNLEIMLLPALTLGTASSAVIMRMTRSVFLEVLRNDYIRTARAKGLHDRVVLARHALKNALIPIVTVVGLQFGQILGGVVVVEEVFALPGLGRTVVQALFERDYPLVQAATLLIALALMLLNLAVDLTYALLDPRVRYA